MGGAVVVVGVVVSVACTDNVVVRVELVVSPTGAVGSARIAAVVGSCIGTGIGIGAGAVVDGGGGERFLLRFLFLVWRCFLCFLCRLWDERDVSDVEEDEDEVSEGRRLLPTARRTKTGSCPSIGARRWPTAPEGHPTGLRSAIPRVGCSSGTRWRPTIRARCWPTATEGLPP